MYKGGDDDPAESIAEIYEGALGDTVVALCVFEDENEKDEGGDDRVLDQKLSSFFGAVERTEGGE